MLSAIQGSSQQQTMTSREMADLTEKRHDSVRRTIETLVSHGTISQPQIVDGEKSANGIIEKIYVIGKRDSYVIVAQLSPEFTARLVDRWQELETAAPKPITIPVPELSPDRQVLVALLYSTQAVEKRQNEQDAVQAAQAAVQATHAETLKRIESNQQAAVASVQSFTALGYSIYREIPMSKIELIRLGKRASAISKKKGITADHVVDGRHGRVGSYHVTVLDEALEELMK